MSVRMGFWNVFMGAFLASLFLACSDSESVAGNSAETGSPELAGILVLNDGAPAAFARVKCVPENFDALYQTLPLEYTAVADSVGAYSFDKLPDGAYALEAFHEESGQRLLVRGLQTADDKNVAGGVADTLQNPGFAHIDVERMVSDGTVGKVIVYGSTMLREVVVENGGIWVDSLPAGALDLLVVYDDSNSTMANYDALEIVPGDTLVLGFENGAELAEKDMPADPDTVKMSFVAPLAAPADADTALLKYSSDIPLLLRLDSSRCDLAALDTLEGRWQAQRISPDGTRSVSLPIMQLPRESNEEILFWVRVDSLNFADSLELTFNTSLEPAFAKDVFPTSRVYTAVWEFESGVTQVEDAAEKGYFPAVGADLEQTAGVVGEAALFKDGASFVVQGSAIADSAKQSNLDYGFTVNLSFSLWVKLDDVSKPQTIFAKGESQYDLRYAPDSGFVVEQFCDTAAYKLTFVTGDSLVQKGEWTYVAFSRTEGGAYSLLVNGKKIATTANEVAWNGEVDHSEDFAVGGFSGSLDELFIAGASRSDSWMYVTYLNQKYNWPEF